MFGVCSLRSGPGRALDVRPFVFESSDLTSVPSCETRELGTHTVRVRLPSHA